MNRVISLITIVICLFFLFRCGLETNGAGENPEVTGKYLNLHDSAQYVGINTCKLCHQSIYNSFIETGMGKSFDLASKKKSSAKFNEHALVYDEHSDFYYQPFWEGDNLKIKEFRLDKNDTTYKRIEKVDYIIGSGQHTNSHISNTNGYLTQAPMTFYTQKAIWDLPPGFEDGFNTRFSRKIGLECMSCHNSYPDFVEGSENKFTSVPTGINCERCHGPGSIHVDQKRRGIVVDTSREIDYSIVNPRKLTDDLQFDICQRCHLQGNAVLKENHSFLDFKPGMRLSDVVTVFLPRYQNGEKDFIMASHADRLKMSKCYLLGINTKQTRAKFNKKGMTCITCHDPHKSVKITGKEVFNTACKNCHQKNETAACSEKLEVRREVKDNCVSCHMPKSGSIDIPHVSITDHFIRKPISEKEIIDVKKFIDLYAVNEKNPDDKTLAQAYLNQYEKFDPNTFLLDSAEKHLKSDTKNELIVNLNELIQLHFFRKNYHQISAYIKKLGVDESIGIYLNKKSLSNKNAWSCYRVGEAFINLNQPEIALKFYSQAVTLAPFHLEFKNKLASVYFSLRQIEKAKELYESILKENPKFASAYCNLGYCRLSDGNYIDAEKLYKKALSLDPENEQTLLNMAQLLILRNENRKAVLLLRKVLKVNPSNITAKRVLESLS